VNGYGAVVIVVTVVHVDDFFVGTCETCARLAWASGEAMFGELEWVLPADAQYVIFKFYKCGC
jgi:hypothetical protein